MMEASEVNQVMLIATDVTIEPQEQKKYHRFYIQVILSILRSWPGLIHFANPKLRKAPTPLHALVETLNLPNTDVRVSPLACVHISC